MRSDLIVFPPGLPARGNDAALMCRALMAAGIVWRLGGRGPRDYDCWSMTQLVQAHLFGRTLMNVDLGAAPRRTDILRAVAGHEAHRQWREVEGQPQHGDVVTMAHRMAPWHVGVWLDVDRGVIAHCAEECGFRVDDVVALKATGWLRLKFHRYIGEVRR